MSDARELNERGEMILAYARAKAALMYFYPDSVEAADLISVGCYEKRMQATFSELANACINPKPD